MTTKNSNTDDTSASTDTLNEQLSSNNKKLAKEKQDIEAQSIIKNHVMAGMTASLIPIPVVDIMALSVAQLNLLRSLSQHYEVEFEERSAKSILTAIMSGALPVLSFLGFSSAFKLIPGIGTLAGGTTLSLSSGATIYSVGQVFTKHFSQGGNLQDFDIENAVAFFKEEMEQGKKFVENLNQKK